MKIHQLKSNYRVRILRQKDEISVKSYEVALRNAMVGLRNVSHVQLHPARMFYIDKIAYLHRINGNYAQALTFYQQKHDLALKSKRDNEVLDALYWQGVLYERTGYSKKAIKLLFKALEFDNNEYKVKVFNCLAILYQNLNQPDNAVIYIEKALKLTKFLASYEDMIDTYMLAGNSYFQTNQLLKSTSYLEKAFSLIEKKSVYKKYGVVYFLKGKIQATQNQIEDAIESLNRAFKYFKINNVWHSLVHCSIILAQVLEADDETDKAIDILEDAILIVQDSNLLQEYKDICFQLQRFYKKINRLDTAYDYLIKVNELKDELHQRQLSFFRNQVKDELSDEIELISEDLKYSHIKNDQLQKELSEIQEHVNLLSKEKQSVEDTIKVFADNLRYPMNKVYRMAQLLYRKNNDFSSDDHTRQLHYFLKETQKLDDYFTDLMYYSLVQKYEEIEDREINTVKQILKDLGQDINHLKQNKNDIRIITNEDMPEIWVDEEHYRLLFSHLMFNLVALTVLDAPFFIEIHVSEKEDAYEFEIIDMRVAQILDLNKNQKEDVTLPKIFDLLKLLDFVAAEGVGASLALCQKVVNLYQGKIWATFIRQHGYIFTFTLPKSEVLTIKETRVSSQKNDYGTDLKNFRVRYRIP